MAKAVPTQVINILTGFFQKGLSFNKAHTALKALGYTGKTGFRRQDLQSTWTKIKTGEAQGPPPKRPSRDRFCFAAKDVTGRKIEGLKEIVRDWHDRVTWETEQELVDDILGIELTDDSPTRILAVALLVGANIEKNLAAHKKVLEKDGFEYVADTSAVQYTKLALAYIGACVELTDSALMAFEFVSRVVMLTRAQDPKYRNKRLFGWLSVIVDEFSQRL